jgi:hypothetical protein
MLSILMMRLDTGAILDRNDYGSDFSCGDLGHYEESEEDMIEKFEMINILYRAGNFNGSNPYTMPGIRKQVKKWYTMEDYEKDPDRYVYYC